MSFRLRDYQRAAVDFLVQRGRGFVVAPAGAGKTAIVAQTVAERGWPGCRAGILVNTREQLEQMITAFGRVDGPEMSIDVQCAAAMPDFSKCDIVVVDEAHHSPAASWMATIRQSGKILYGVSATPWSEDEERNKVLRDLFVDFHSIDRSVLLDAGFLAPGKVYLHDLDEEGQSDPEIETKTLEETAKRVARYPRLPSDPVWCKQMQQIKTIAAELLELKDALWMQRASAGLVDDSKELPHVVEKLNLLRSKTQKLKDYVRQTHESHIRWQLTQECIQTNTTRNAKACEIASEYVRQGRSVLLLVQSVEHGQQFVDAIPGARIAHSKLPIKTRRKNIQDFQSGECKVLVATSLADEGLDVVIASVLVLVCGGRSAAKLEQRAGRVLRPCAEKSEGTIHDFVDRGCRMGLAQANARIRVYSKLGYDPEIVDR